MVVSDLNEDENSFRSLAENLPGIVYRVLIEEDNRMIFFNDMVQTMTGYSPEDLKKGEVCSIDPLILPEDRLKVINIVKDAIENNVPFEVEYRIHNKSGEVKWFSERGRHIRRDNGNPSYIDGVIFDNTERKETEQKLKESEEKYRYLIENSLDGVWVVDSNANTILINPSMAKMLGYTIEEMVGKSLFLFMEEKEIKNTKRHLERRKKGISEERDLELIQKNGKKVYLRIRASPIFDIEGNYEGTFAFFSNITQRKLAKQNSKENIKKLEVLNQIILSGNKAEDLTILLKTVLESILKLMDFDGGGIYLVDETNRTAQIAYQKGLPPDFFEHAKKVKIDEGNYRKVFIEGVPLYTNNYPQINPERAKKWNILSLASIPLFTKDRIVGSLNIASKSRYAFTDDEKNLLQSIGAETGTLIEKMFVEQSLRESELRFRNLFENAPDSISIVDSNGVIIDCNKQEELLLGYNREEIIGKNINTFHTEKYKNLVNLKMQDIQKTGHVEAELEIIRKNGKKIPIWRKGSAIKNVNDQIEEIIAHSRDISERKKAELIIKESEEKYRKQNVFLNNILESLTHPFYVINVEDYTVALANSTASSEGLEHGQFCYKLTHNNNKPCETPCECPIDEVKNTKKTCVVEHIHYDKEGNEKIYEIYGYPILDESGNVVQMIEYALNITDRKRAEKNQRKIANQWRTTFDAMSESVFLLDLEKNILQCNKATLDILGKEKYDEIIGHSCCDVIHGTNEPVEWCPMMRLIGSSHKESSIAQIGDRWCEISVDPVNNDEGTLIGAVHIIKDITERKKVERDLKESEERFKTLFEVSPASIVYSDQNGNILMYNKQFLKLHGIKRPELIRRTNVSKFFSKQDLPKLRNQIQRSIEGEAPNPIEYLMLKEDGTEFRAEASSTAVRDKNGIVVGLIGVAQDITNRKKAEQKLIESEEKYRDLFESSPISLWEEDFSQLKNYIEILKNSGIEDLRVYFDKNPEEVKKCSSMVKIVDINKKTLEIYKVNKKEDFFAGLEQVFTEESLYTFKEQIISFAGGETRFESEAINCTLNGDKLYIFIVCEIVAGFKEDWSKILVSIVDISERKKAEQKLIESEEKFRTIAERTLMGILIIQDNQVKYVNEALLNMFEYSQKEIENWEMDDLAKLINSEDLSFLREYREHLRSGETNLKPYYSYRVFTKSGKIKWIDQFSKKIQYKGRSAELVTIMDITEKKEVEQELIKLNNLKSELLRRTSHELRTPLVSIKGFSDLLLELHRDKLDDYVIMTVKQIRMGCNRLESLINDILKTAKLESGTVELKKSKEDLSLLIKTCVGDLEGLSELRNHTINLEIPDKLICSFEKEQIYNVITNILSNAIKFTPYNGKIEVKSEINNDFIVISIKDNGIGFTEEERNLIFKQFGKIERYGQGYDVVSEGSGLGLYISKKIVELHDGEIWLESEGRDKGSTFYFSLPIV